MSKMLYAYCRSNDPEEIARLRERIDAGAARLLPEPGMPWESNSFDSGKLVVSVVNPASTILTKGCSVCLGHVDKGSRWYETGTESPRGTYAICRKSGRQIELVSDAVASRTLWYVCDEKLFLASTSQRWISAVLGSFVPNPRARSWMIAAGNLGPVDAWDRRVGRLAHNSILKFDTDTWSVKTESYPLQFEVTGGGAQTYTETLASAMKAEFESLEFDFSKWVLPLSGGYDSRAILLMLRNKTKLRAITWGTSDSQADQRSDASVAAVLAKETGVQHEFFETDPVDITIKEVFDRFISIGEGRVDHISGYLDGFVIWKTLMSRGIEGVIRGDEGFGWKDVGSVDDARRSVGLMLWSDLVDAPADNFGLEGQILPESLAMRQSESIAQWRDRLYHEFRIPTILASLTDLKSIFVEVANPLLNHAILDIVRGMPDDLRTNKSTFKQIVDKLSPAIPYAETKAIADRLSVLRSPEAVTVIANELNTAATAAILPTSLIDYVRKNLVSRGVGKKASGRVRFRRMLKALLPERMRRSLPRRRARLKLDANLLGFRIYIVSRTTQMMQKDAALEPETPSGCQ